MKLKKISDVEWEIPMKDDMKVPGRIFTSKRLSKDFDNEVLEQVKNIAKLPGILKASYAMPDMHMGYGFPIGGVAAFDIDEGVISPGGVGYDINCSVRLLKTNLKAEDLAGKEKEISSSLFRAIPSGVGRKGQVLLNNKELDKVLVGGAQWAVKNGYGKKDDWIHTEESGKLLGTNILSVSQKAKGRGMHQLGSLGAGNHFLDVLIVDEVFDKKIAKVFGLEVGQVVILIHCGSRGLGHQVASDYIKLMKDEYSHSNFDKGLVNAPIKSKLGKEYLEAMSCAANFAFANKQVITHLIREDMKKYFPNFKADVVYDVCHNIAKFEKFGNKEVLVIRKGATRSFGPGRVEIPKDYRSVGQPVLIPGSMGTSSYVLCGTKKAEEISWGSTAHGAGRVRSRTESHKKMSFEDAKEDMKKRGIFVEFGGQKGLVEESPFSYKNIDEVIRVSDEAGLGKKVAKLTPIIVIIG